jgi:hypothetical protein
LLLSKNLKYRFIAELKELIRTVKNARYQKEKRKIKTELMATAIVLSMFLCMLPITTEAQSDTVIPWQDDFSNKNPRWTWEYNAGTGYKICPKTTDYYVVAELGITSASSHTTYSDCDISTPVTISSGDVIVFEARMKFSDTGLDQSRGSRGFCWWIGGGTRGVDSCITFWCQTSEDKPSGWEGWRAIVAHNDSFDFNQPLTVDPLNWHVYRIEVYPSSIVFKIDDSTVATASIGSTTVNGEGKMDFWTDNCTWDFNDQLPNMDCTINEIMYVDYCYLNQNGGIAPTPTPTPTPSPTPSPSPTPTLAPTPTPTPTTSPTSTPPPTPTLSPTPTQSPESSNTEFLTPEAFYALGIIGVAIVIAIVILVLNRRKKKQ